MLGLTITSPQGRTWSVTPHISGLSAAEGGFETALGWFGIKWSAKRGNFSIELHAPEGTTGTLRVPFSGMGDVDGVRVDHVKGESLQLAGGSHVVSVIRDM